MLKLTKMMNYLISSPSPTSSVPIPKNSFHHVEKRKHTASIPHPLILSYKKIIKEKKETSSEAPAARQLPPL